MVRFTRHALARSGTPERGRRPAPLQKKRWHKRRGGSEPQPPPALRGGVRKEGWPGRRQARGGVFKFGPPPACGSPRSGPISSPPRTRARQLSRAQRSPCVTWEPCTPACAAAAVGHCCYESRRAAGFPGNARGGPASPTGCRDHPHPRLGRRVVRRLLFAPPTSFFRRPGIGGCGALESGHREGEPIVRRPPVADDPLRPEFQGVNQPT